jgi:hypothetical protein
MNIVDQRKEFYFKRKEESENNIHYGIPWNIVFPKIGSLIPVIPKGQQMLWTAGSGIGKTQSWIGIILYSIYRIKKYHPEVNLKTKIIISLLEDTKEMFIDRLYSMILYDRFKVKIPGFELQSMGKTIDKKYLPMIEETAVDIKFLLEDCEIIDSVYNPTGIYKWCRSVSNKYGEHVYEEREFVNDDKSTYFETVYKEYKLKEEYKDYNFLLILDNLNNLQQEKEDGRLLSERETLNLWSRRYCRLQIAKHWKWAILNVIQQAADSEKPQYNNRGDLVIDKIKPSLDGLGNSKEVQRDHFIVWGLFSPNRFNIQTYPEENGYDIGVFENHFRALILLKSNLSESNVEIPLYFDGGMSMVRELPTIQEMDSKVYDRIRELKKL